MDSLDMYLKGKKLNFFRLDRVFKKPYKIAKACKSFYSPMTYRYYMFLVSCLVWYIKGGFIPKQVFQLGLGLSFTSNEKINKYIGYYKMMKIIGELDPKPLWPISDKGKFYTICMNSNLPIPKLYAILFKKNKSVSYINSSVIKKSDLIEFIRNELPNEFVIKPCMGEQGLFINAYKKTGFGITNQQGDLKTEQDIYDSMMNHKQFYSFIVQERLSNHPYFLKVHPCEYLHNVRIITFINSAGQFKILHAHLNLASEGQNIASQKGNLKIKISQNDGIFEYGILMDIDKGGFKKITEHPETGKNFKEFKLPFWKDILSFSKKAALEFLPWRTLGWDFAITEKGVKILEANIGYSAPNLFGEMDKIIKTLLDD